MTNVCMDFEGTLADILQDGVSESIAYVINCSSELQS